MIEKIKVLLSLFNTSKGAKIYVVKDSNGKNEIAVIQKNYSKYFTKFMHSRKDMKYYKIENSKGFRIFFVKEGNKINYDYGTYVSKT